MSPQSRPATAESGFTLSAPPLENPFTCDISFKRVLAWYLPQDILQTIEPDLTKFAEEAVSGRFWDWDANAETWLPYAKSYNVWGQ
ncbi:acyl-CoA dehydrogenase [Aspergillus sclerotialis]|uniref:Acyl-CoA dehydrogenase n=1 Tax=Aspergillus sclerotialis TaxID=2070753 RepID=A0A3A2ZFQ7_9EURO|nr:acyl-CoA dehydrogenase [Aspergillus sclerotialis]